MQAKFKSIFKDIELEMLYSPPATYANRTTDALLHVRLLAPHSFLLDFGQAVLELGNLTLLLPKGATRFQRLTSDTGYCSGFSRY